jgi:hypothetical protein
MSAPPGPPGGGNIKIVFTIGNVGNYFYQLQRVPSGGAISGLASQSPTGTGVSGVYTGLLEASGTPSFMLYGSTTFSGDVTLVFGPLVTVLEDG